MAPSVSPAPPTAAPSCRPSAVARVFDDRPFRADGDVLALAFAADGTLWSVEDPGVLRRWDLTGRRQLAWHTLSDLENLWTFSGDARVVASASDDVSLWDVATGQLKTVQPQASWVTALALSGDAALVAAGLDDGCVGVWNAVHDDLVHELRGHDGAVSALAFSADGRRLASAGEDRTIRLWNLADGSCFATLQGPYDRIPALAWHPQGHRLYSSGWDTAVWVWDVATGEPLILLNSHEGQIQAFALSPDGRRLACADSGRSLHVWDLATHRTLHVFRGYEGEAKALAFRPDGTLLVSGGTDRVVLSWGPTAPPVETAPATEPRAGLALSPDGQRLASLSPGKGVRVWETEGERKLFDLEAAGDLAAVAYSPDGRLIAGGGADHALTLWDATTGQRHATLHGPALPLTALAFAPKGSVLATGSAAGCDVWLWHAERGEPMLVVPDAADGCSVEALAFAPRGDLLAVAGVDWLATGGGDGAIGLWDVVRPHRAGRLPGGARALAFHPAGRLLATATLKRTVRIWDVSSGELVRELTEHDDAVTCVAYSPDGRTLVSGSDDRTLRLWDVATGETLGVTELDSQIKFVCFAPDGRSLFTGNGNTSCYQLKTHRLGSS